MNAFGVVAEFNPFHKGHAYFIEKAKEMTGSECCVAAISGDFTQRGEPAIFDKWERAKLAVEHGVDLVLEIPQVFACQSAPYFARGGVGVLRASGIPDYLCFGSECGDIDKLKKTAEFISSNEETINREVAALVKNGEPYPAARSKVLAGIDGDLIAEPGSNDILALEYLMQDMSGMEPVAVKRRGPGDWETATAIRESMINNDPGSYEKAQDRLFSIVASRVLSSDPDDLEGYSSSGDGLGHRLYNEIRYTSGMSQLCERLNTRVYTLTRIKRLLINIALGIRNTDLKEPLYIRVLAMNGRGSRLLKEAMNSSVITLPVISNLSKETESLSDEAKNMISFDMLAGDVYNIIKHNDLYENCDLVRKPYKI